MRDASALRRKLCALACLPLLSTACNNSAPSPVAGKPGGVRTNPSAKKDDAKQATLDLKGETKKSAIGPRMNAAEPPPPLPTDPEELRLMPIAGDPPHIDGYNSEEETCPSGNWCGTVTAAQAIAPKAGEPQMEMGCPKRIIGAHSPSPIKGEAYEGLSAKNSMQGNLNQHGTELTRAKDGNEDTCCYHYFEYCSGRPLIDGSDAVTAPSIARTDWADLAAPVHSSIAEELAAAWLDDAAAEHASVAAFSRVVMELMAVGAPPELLEGTLEAASDEVRHAQACYGVASRFGKKVLGPGALPVVPMRASSLAQVAVDAFVEGCVGETTAALIAERGAALAADRHVKDVLSTIAHDESRHAALAWRTLRWALEVGGSDVAGALRQAWHDLAPASLDPTPDHVDWARFGRLSEDQQRAAMNDARREIVEPMLRALLGAERPTTKFDAARA